MKFEREHPSKARRLPGARTIWIGILAGLAAIAIAPVGGRGMLQEQNPERGFPQLPPAVNRSPDAYDQAKMREQHDKQKNFEAANAERKKEIAEESVLLLKLATDLKSEVDKTNKDTLSITVIRKADAIEKLARDVKEKMKLSVGAS